MKKAWLTGILMLAVSPLAFSHTIAIGSSNAGAPGSVTLWMGTYDHGIAISQGSIQLIAGPSNVGAIQAFTTVVTTIPTGLIAGTNYFFADATPSTFGSLAADSFNSPSNTVGIGPVVNWQGATFTGLAAGTYTYQLSGMTSANWNNINSFTDNWTGTLFIPRQSVTTVPEPGSLALFGLGLLGLGMARRRRSA